MSTDRFGIEMTNAEIEAFLAERGHGVLSFGGAAPYGIPLSFGYDDPQNRCIFQLFSGSESKKRSSLAATDAVSLVAYEWAGVDDWRSVVVDGQLGVTDPGMPEAQAVSEIFAEHGSVVGTEVFNRPLEELESEWYELDIERMSGYESPISGYRSG